MSERARKSEVFYNEWAFKPWGFATIGVIDELHDKYFNKHCEDDKWLHDDCVLMFSLQVAPIDETDEVFDEFIRLASKHYRKNGLEFKMLGAERYGRKNTVNKYYLVSIPRLPNLNDREHVELLGGLWDEALNGRYGRVAQKGYDHSCPFVFLLTDAVTRNRDENGYCAFAFVSYGINSKKIKAISGSLDSRGEWYEQYADIEG